MSEEIVNENILSFEDFRHENGVSYWWASDVMMMLGYKDMKSFKKVIDKTTKTFVSLKIDNYDHIKSEERDLDGKKQLDYRMSRFACYLSVMSADSKKKEVAEAQSYFAQQTRKFELYVESQQVERILTREELVDGNKSLQSTAKVARVLDYANFTNAGYLGMYNKTALGLKKHRGISSLKGDKGNLFNYMGRAELAANLFRTTQTEERIKNKEVQGQQNLENTHREVGEEVREFVKKSSDKYPEDFKQEQALFDVKKNLRKVSKEMKKKR